MSTRTNPLEHITRLAVEGGPELYDLLKDMTAEELLEALREYTKGSRPEALA